MKRSTVLSLRCGVALLLLAPAIASAQRGAVSVNFGESNYALGATESAGVEPFVNWNNATTAPGGTGPSNASNFAAGKALNALKDNSGTTTGVNLTYFGSSVDYNDNLTSSSSTGDNKMMSHYWGTNNEVQITNLFVPGGTQNTQNLAQGGLWGPISNWATFTNLNAAFPSGYDVYVYVSGANPFFNEVAGTNPSTARNFVNPVHVLAGPGGSGGLKDTVQQGNTTSANPTTKPMMSFGANNNGTAGLSIEDIFNLPFGSQRTILWPAVLKNSGGALPGGQYYSADFQGFVAGSLDVVDSYPMDYGTPNEWGHVTTQFPQDMANWYANSSYGAAAIWDPTFRSIPLSNYIKFEGMEFDTLDVLARNVHGSRSTGGSTSLTEMGGITGIQIVGVVPEPSGVALGGVAAVALAVIARRRCRRAARG